MAAKLIRNVWVRGAWYGPAYPDAGNPPAGAVSNPQCWEGDDSPGKQPDAAPPTVPEPGQTVTPAGPPPKSGKGATDAAWTEYARLHGVEVTEEMKRSEVIAAVEAAGVPTE